MEVGAVVASDDDEGAVYHGGGVAEEVDASVLVELLGVGFTTVVFVIPQAGIDRRIQTAELGSHAFFDEGTDAAVDDVASDEDEVWMFGIHHIHPTGEFGAWVVVAEMEVTCHDDFVVVGKWFGGG